MQNKLRKNLVNALFLSNFVGNIRFVTNNET